MNQCISQTLKIGSYISSIIIGGLLLIISIVALVDPVGTKMADHGDPFGEPDGLWKTLLLIIVSIILILWPLTLKIIKTKKKK